MGSGSSLYHSDVIRHRTGTTVAYLYFWLLDLSECAGAHIRVQFLLPMDFVQAARSSLGVSDRPRRSERHVEPKFNGVVVGGSAATVRIP